MKIAILTSGIRPVPAVQGGAVENLIDFYLEYNEQHRLHDITVYSLWHPDAERHQALGAEANHYIYIKTNTIWGKIKKKLYQQTRPKGYYHPSIEYFLHEVLRRMSGRHFDTVIIENRPAFILQLKHSPTTRYILHLHNDFLNAETPKAAQILSGYDRVVSVSDYISRRVQTAGPAASQCLTVHNAIDTKLFQEARPLSRSTIGLQPDDFVIVYSGRMIPEKGILPLIQAVKQLSVPNIRLLVIGASAYGHDKHPTPYIRQLQQEAEAMKDQVVFTGFVPYPQIPAYLKTANLAVVPSLWEEPFGLTVVEAMAAGRPLITTRSGGIPEICEGVAVVVEPDDIVGSLAAAILHLYHHPGEQRRMGLAARQRALLFGKEHYARCFFEAINACSSSL